MLAVVGVDRQNSPRVAFAATDEYQFKDLPLALQTMRRTILKVPFEISEFHASLKTKVDGYR